ncbi:MAG TPA: hypothetical protein VI365_30295 [Trebonia sp.]
MAAIAATGISVGLVSVVAAPARAAATSPATPETQTAATYSTIGDLLGVAAGATNNAWAVGYTGQDTSPKILLLHWNGSSWSKVRFKDSGAAGELSAVTVVNSKDAWAVGYTDSLYGTPHTLILHYNGSTWNPVTSPAPIAGGSLTAVWASTKQVWAVGYSDTGPSVVQTFPLSFHLSGTRWSVIRSSKDGGDAFDGVTTTTSGITFASGLYTGMITGFLERWNGSSWGYTSFPESATYHWLNGVAAGPDGTAFSMGFSTAADSYDVIAVEWNGHSWVKAPVSAPKGSSPDTVAEAPGGTMWSGGSYSSGSSGHALILRWSGKKWIQVTSPSTSAQLSGLGFASAKYGWAVGETPYSNGSKTYILHWNGSTWS